MRKNFLPFVAAVLVLSLQPGLSLAYIGPGVGAGAIGAACTSDATCSSNTLCSTYNAQQRCRKVCTRPAGNECATVPGTTCVGFGTPGLVIGGTEYGVCAP